MTKTNTPFGKLHQNWPLEPLAEHVFFQGGPGLRKWQWTDSGMKVINVTNILGDGSVDVSNTSRFISLDEFEHKYSHFAVEDGDIVVASSGNTYGKVGRIGRSHLPLMMNTSVIRFHPKRGSPLDHEYLYAFLRSHLFRNQVESLVIGSAQPNFGPAHLKQMLIPVPPPPTQRKIAAILSAYDDLIENNLQRIKILEEIAQLIYHEWFGNFGFPGHENVKLVDSELGMIPGNWRLRRLGDMAHFVRGIEPGSKNYLDEPKGGTVPFIRVGDLGSRQSGLFIPEELAKGRFLDMHDIAVTLDGTVGIVQMGLTGAYSTGIRKVVVQDSEQLPWAYVYFLLKSERIQGIIRSHTRGTTIQHASSAIDHMTFVCPPTNLMRTFDSYASPLLRGMLNIMHRNAILRHTRDPLLPKLISGELNVSGLDIDIGEEPE